MSGFGSSTIIHPSDAQLNDSSGDSLTNRLEPWCKNLYMLARQLMNMAHPMTQSAGCIDCNDHSLHMTDKSMSHGQGDDEMSIVYSLSCKSCDNEGTVVTDEEGTSASEFIEYPFEAEEEEEENDE